MSISWPTELPLIKAEAARRGTDFLVPILRAVRMAEGGAAGREFGVLSVSAPTYAEQLHMAAATVMHRLWSYPGNPLTTTPNGELIVSPNWVAYFASIWAPSGVANDPTNLNANWTKDFLHAYNGFIAAAVLPPHAP